MQQELTSKTTTLGLKKYFDIATDGTLQLICKHDKQKKKYSISKESHKFTNQLDLTLKEIDIKLKTIKRVKSIRRKNTKTKSSKSHLG